eukprot:CAMPEP_0119545980 /NCGR_PEP_ID=MMETSP1352-20130426/576_1 /TAXON_ID=265584 /ORGANISM="Stauroneis constricta, Strain CCMP1120" /LENGTH=237 /DNA_ID=CAMNT_0007590619 /DNA_START=79 /DNA_END=792 /DNA_ORIENTATION=+
MAAKKSMERNEACLKRDNDDEVADEDKCHDRVLHRHDDNDDHGADGHQDDASNSSSSSSLLSSSSSPFNAKNGRRSPRSILIDERNDQTKGTTQAAAETTTTTTTTKHAHKRSNGARSKKTKQPSSKPVSGSLLARRLHRAKRRLLLQHVSQDLPVSPSSTRALSVERQAHDPSSSQSAVDETQPQRPECVYSMSHMLLSQYSIASDDSDGDDDDGKMESRLDDTVPSVTSASAATK